MLRAHIELVTDDREVLNHSAPHVRNWHCSMLSAVRYYPTLLRMNTLLRVSASNVKHEFNSVYSRFTLQIRTPLPPSWNIIYLLWRSCICITLSLTLPWTEIQIVTFSAMNMDLPVLIIVCALYSYFIDWNRHIKSILLINTLSMQLIRKN